MAKKEDHAPEKSGGPQQGASGGTRPDYLQHGIRGAGGTPWTGELPKPPKGPSPTKPPQK